VTRTAQALAAHGAGRMVLIDSIAPARAPFAGRAGEAPRLDGAPFDGLISRLTEAAKIGREQYGLTVSLHAHAGGYIEFEDELDRVLDAIDESLLKICLDSGHCAYAGFDPVATYRRLAGRIDYLHLKDVDLRVRERAVAESIGFYDVCAQGVFCNLGRGSVDFEELRLAIEETGFNGWATIEQDCDPAGATSPIDDARINLEYLRSLNLAG
jgi:inosose dehydratase